MPSLDEMLAAMAEAEDGDEDTGTEVTPPKPNSAIKQIRDHAKKLERELERERKQREELTAWKEQRVAEDSTNALKAAGLSPRQAEVFLKFYDGVTPENVAEFRKDVLGQAGAAEASEGSEFRPTGNVGDSGSEGKPLSLAELKKLSPEAQVEAALAGKVQFRTE